MARGDHVEVTRYGYRHHGIDLGDGTVVHFTGEPMRKLQAAVQRTGWDEFTRGDPYRTVVHTGQTWTSDHTCLRALKLLGATGYDLARNNCEHFAAWCRTGEKRSLQIEQSVRTIARYSRFGVVNPALLLAGPAAELGRRTVAASLKALGQMVGVTTASAAAPAPQATAPILFFHYVDLYTASGEAYFVTPYGQWQRLAPTPETIPPVAGAVPGGRVYADDHLMVYLLRADGVLLRMAPGDNDLAYTATQYVQASRHYRLMADGTAFSVRSDGFAEPTTAIPAGATPVAMLFRDVTTVRAVTAEGWFILSPTGPQPEPRYRAPLPLV